MTKEMPASLSAGIWAKNVSKAARPPAEAPMPMIGKLLLVPTCPVMASARVDGVSYFSSGEPSPGPACAFDRGWLELWESFVAARRSPTCSGRRRRLGDGPRWEDFAFLGSVLGFFILGWREFIAGSNFSSPDSSA